MKSILNAKYQGKRIFFSRETTSQQMSEADLILVLNKALVKAGKRINICLFYIRYLLSEAVSRLPTKKANASLLIP